MLKKFFDHNKKAVKQLEKKAEEVEVFSAKIEVLSDDELKAKTEEFKQRYQNGETLDYLLPEAFAVCREAAKRVLGMKPYKVQIMGSIALHNGDIPEMKTGEGKTLTATMAVYLNAISGKGVHVVTVNEYLSARDAKEMGELYEWLGLTVGLNSTNLSNEKKKQAYDADITYSTNNELGFDYLRDNMVKRKEDRVQRPLNFALIDEVDSILIDEARTPLIISGKSNRSTALYFQSDKFIRVLQPEDYKYEEDTKNVTLTESGVEKAEQGFSVENLYDLKCSALNHAIQQSLKAHMSYQKDVDYVVRDGEVMIVDGFTGRIMKGRRYSDGLHQALEAKEQVEIKNEAITMGTVTFQNYFRKYAKLSGMTGTAKTEEEEFRNVYNMTVIVIPTNKPIQREDKIDLVFKTLESKLNAIAKETKERHEKGQPVLIGTVSIEMSEQISERLKKYNIPHNVLNAKNHEREAEIIQNTGQFGAVTVATNMAGRGTDIKPGEGVLEVGGLAVIGTERHESRRIDNQLRGRSGRQGNVGVTQFYLSLEDDLMIRLGSERMSSMLNMLGLEDDQPLKSKAISKAVESSQEQAEGNNFDSRKRLLNFDDVIREQREIIYKEREEVLDSDDTKSIIKNMIQNVIKEAVNLYSVGNQEEFFEFIELNLLNKDKINVENFEGKTSEEITEILTNITEEMYNEKEFLMGSEVMENFAKNVLLHSIDTNWVSHMESMEQIKEGIHLRAYAQINPLREYQNEGFILFDETTGKIKKEVTRYILKSQVKKKEEETLEDANQKQSPPKEEPVNVEIIENKEVAQEVSENFQEIADESESEISDEQPQTKE